MKKLIPLMLIAMSATAFAQQQHNTMPKEAIHNGSLPMGNYEFHEITYHEDDGLKPRPDRKIQLLVVKIDQEKHSEYSKNVGKSGSEGIGRVTDIRTTIDVQVTANKRTFLCQLHSDGVSDGMGDGLGFDDARLVCYGKNSEGEFKLTLADYSFNRVEGTPLVYDINIRYETQGLFRTKSKSITAEIAAD